MLILVHFGQSMNLFKVMRVERLDVHMIYPFHLSFSTLIGAFYDTACEIIIENSARS
jgi:hypothetical protein